MRRLQTFPLVSGYSRLAQNAIEETGADLTTMRIGKYERLVTASEELVLTAGIRPHEPQLPKVLDQILQDRPTSTLDFFVLLSAAVPYAQDQI